mmetsp:Transcript_24739/g.55719  ORF Transcript_24739/g.55719 Transcript_24739/m.55719 type:complete len:270 (-) Transcript_24739:156-965(-)
MAAGCSRHSLMVQCGCGSGLEAISSSGATSTRPRSRDVPSARTTPISPSCMAMKLLVYLLKAAGSEATKVLPGPSPMVMGDPLHATTNSSTGSNPNLAFALPPEGDPEGDPEGKFEGFRPSPITANPQVPSQRRSALAVASLTDSRGPAFSASRRFIPINCAITSVSVCDVNSTPLACSSRRSSFALLIVPLCTREIRPSESQWGWAFSSVLPPCVAQRVWAIPTQCPACASPDEDRTRSIESALSPSDANLVTWMELSGFMVASPAES